VTPGARIPKLAPSSLDDEQRSLYDAIAGGRRAQGPQLFQLAAARDGRHVALAGREAVVARTVAALVERCDLDDAEYREATEVVGTAGLFELLTLVGYYATLALQLRVFRVPAPDGPAQPA
jgi:4-carboxymuconolactone decarboxylase